MKKLKWKRQWSHSVSEGISFYSKDSIVSVGSVYRTKYMEIFSLKEGETHIYESHINVNYKFWNCSIQWPELKIDKSFNSIGLKCKLKFKNRWMAKLEVEKMLDLIRNNIIIFDSLKDLEKYNWCIEFQKQI